MLILNLHVQGRVHGCEVTGLRVRPSSAKHPFHFTVATFKHERVKRLHCSYLFHCLKIENTQNFKMLGKIFKLKAIAGGQMIDTVWYKIFIKKTIVQEIVDARSSLLIIKSLLNSLHIHCCCGRFDSVRCTWDSAISV